MALIELENEITRDRKYKTKNSDYRAGSPLSGSRSLLKKGGDARMHISDKGEYRKKASASNVREKGQMIVKKLLRGGFGG